MVMVVMVVVMRRTQHPGAPVPLIAMAPVPGMAVVVMVVMVRGPQHPDAAVAIIPVLLIPRIVVMMMVVVMIHLHGDEPGRSLGGFRIGEGQSFDGVGDRLQQLGIGCGDRHSGRLSERRASP